MMLLRGIVFFLSVVLMTFFDGIDEMSWWERKGAGEGGNNLTTLFFFFDVFFLDLFFFDLQQL